MPQDRRPRRTGTRATEPSSSLDRDGAVATVSRSARTSRRDTGSRSAAREDRSRSGAAPPLRVLEEKLAAVRAIGAALAGSAGLDALFAAIVPNVSRLMHAERSTLFLYDPEGAEIWSKFAEGERQREIRLGLGRGIAGWVARERRPVCVADAYADPRFYPEVDARTGFHTRSVAAAPVIGRAGELLGVLQVLNGREGAFGDEELGLLEAIAAQVAYAVENASLAQRLLDQNRELEAARNRAERRRAELDLLYQLEQETSAATDLDGVLGSAIGRTCARLRSEAGSVLLVDSSSGKLFFRAVEGPQRDELRQVALDPGDGIVGWVARHGQPAIVNRPADDERHARGLAERLGYPVRAALAVPLVSDQRVIGAIEVLNPSPRPSGAVGYDDEDLKLLTVIAGQLARAVSVALERQARLETERLALVGRMLASVAHDLRSPMTVVSGYAELMAVSDSAAERKDGCERIVHQIDEMTGMVADLLAFARGDTRLRPALVEVEALGHELGENVRLQCAPRGVALEVAAGGGTASVDVGRVKRIVYNLARNAVEALRPGGHLRIRLAAERGGIALAVEDDGPGLPAGLAGRLFEPFVTSGKAHGTGLGLSIVKRFVDDHRGSIAVDSAEGRGTRFEIVLPAAEGEP